MFKVGADAEDFFNMASQSMKETTDNFKDLILAEGDVVNGGGGGMKPGINDTKEGDTASLRSLHDWLLRQDSKAEMKKLPVLPRKHFIQLWHTLHDFFASNDTHSQQLYNSVSVVGTLLLQIGEVGQKLKNDDEGWSITFEQFIVSVLNESDLVEYFEKKK